MPARYGFLAFDVVVMAPGCIVWDFFAKARLVLVEGLKDAVAALVRILNLAFLSEFFDDEDEEGDDFESFCW